MKNYFKHDFYARLDPKLKRLIRVHGAAGYGSYWVIVETLYEQGGYITEDTAKDLAYDIRADEPFVMSILKDFDLFQFKKGKYFSDRVLATLSEIADKSEKAKASGSLGGQAKAKNAMQSEENSIPNANQSLEEVVATVKQCSSEVLPRREDKIIYAAKLSKENEKITGGCACVINKEKLMAQVGYENLSFVGELCYHEHETLDVVIDTIIQIAEEKPNFSNLINTLDNKDIGEIRQRFFSGGKGGKWTRRDITDPMQYITKILTEWKKQRGL